MQVGQPSGKTVARFDELMQALDEDQEGDDVEWKKVFEEDREFNQGGCIGPRGGVGWVGGVLVTWGG